MLDLNIMGRGEAGRVHNSLCGVSAVSKVGRFSPCCDGIPGKGTLGMEERPLWLLASGCSLPWWRDRGGRDVRSYFMFSQKAEMGAEVQLAFLFHRDLAHGVAPPLFRMSLPPLVKPL